MTLPVSGAISFNAINVELGVAGTTQASLGQTSYRTLAGVASGAISMSNFYGKSYRVSLNYTFSANTADASLSLSGLSGYISGKSDITVTINSGVYLYATSTANAGLTLTGGTTGDTLTIVNNGFIMGMGGKGGGYEGNTSITTAIGKDGGTALSISYPCTINNTNASAYIGGGGGGGGGSTVTSYSITTWSGGGGGGGGGSGGDAYSSGILYAGGAGGSIGSSGANGASSGNPGGGGGRIFPSTSKVINMTPNANYIGQGNSGGGTGGAFIENLAGVSGSSTGGGALTNGSATLTGATLSRVMSGGGGWGASGGAAKGPGTLGTGGTAGKAVALNGNSVTWVSGNTTRVYGAVS